MNAPKSEWKEAAILTDKDKTSVEDIQILNMIIDNMPGTVWLMDFDHKVTYINMRYEKNLGYTLGELKKEALGNILAQHSKIELYNVLDDKLKEAKSSKFNCKHTWRVELELLIKGGGSVWTENIMRMLMDENNKPVGFIGVSYDMTITRENLAITNELKESERSKALLLSNLPGMAYRCKYDPDWTMLFVSEGCYELTGYKPENLINNRDLTFNSLIKPAYQGFLWERWEQCLSEGKKFREEYEIITADNKKKWVLEQGQGVYNDNKEVEAIEGLIIDITDRKVREEEIDYLTKHDYLTGLYNRMYFEQLMSRLDNNDNLPLTIAIFDLNGLKLINDAFGNATGDRALIKVSEVMQREFRENDYISRAGGDEFVIIMVNTSGEEAEIIINRIYEIINNQIIQSIKLSISYGYSTKHRPEQSIMDVYKLAENHMHRNKLSESQSSRHNTINVIMQTLYEKSRREESHSKRVGIISARIGEALNMSVRDINELRIIGTLHDIGKIAIEDNILNKPTPLLRDEMTAIRRHSEIGYRILSSINEYAILSENVLAHHERWDGKGYPKKLKGEDIPLKSRIIAIADAYDAMTTDRPYRGAMKRNEAIEELRKNSGKQFDPKLIDIIINEDIMPNK